MGEKGGANTPPDKDLRNIAIPLPELRKPVADAISQANALFNRQSKNPQPYGANVVQPWNATQNAGFGAGVGAANNLAGILNPSASLVSNVGGGRFVGGTPGQGTYDFYANGGFVGQAPGQGTLNAIAGGQFADPAAGPLQALMQRAQGGSGGVGMIADTASGRYLSGNPNLDAVIANQSRDIKRDYGDAVSGLEGRASAAGRLGSNAEMDLQGRAQQNLGQALGDLENRTRYQDYAGERGYQQQAQLALPGAFATDIGTGVTAANAAGANNWQKLQAMLSGAQGAGAGYRADQALQLQGAGGAAQTYQNSLAQALQAAGMAPEQAQAQFMGADKLMGYGSLAQSQGERQAQEAQDRLRYGQGQGWDTLGKYLAALQGAGGMVNPSAGAAAAPMPDTHSTVGDIAMLIGATGQAAGAYKCDQRLKTDVVRLGTLRSGAGLYRYRYKWDEPGTVHVGPMAQELLEVQPEAVVNVKGVLMVDLARAL